MLPESTLQPDSQLLVQSPSKTYYWDKDRNSIVGLTDGLQALEQALDLILSTERFEYLVYSSNYGVELNSLIGTDLPYIKADLRRRLSEAITQDDRFTSVENLEYRLISKDSLHVSFKVNSIIGTLDYSKEVEL